MYNNVYKTDVNNFVHMSKGWFSMLKVGFFAFQIMFFFNSFLPLSFLSCYIPDTDSSLPLIAGGAATGGITLAVIVIVVVVLFRRFRSKGIIFQLTFTADFCLKCLKLMEYCQWSDINTHILFFILSLPGLNVQVSFLITCCPSSIHLSRCPSFRKLFTYLSSSLEQLRQI